MNGPIRQNSSARKRWWLKWGRWFHAYTSMLALVLTLFFGLTGLTLNHPTWTFGDDTTERHISGAFAAPARSDGVVDYLMIAETVRNQDGVTGQIKDYRTAGDIATLAFAGPGYSADVQVDLNANTYEVVVVEQGWVAVLNDLHKGRDTQSGWKWVIDLSAVFLVVISISGLLLQLLLVRRRTAALVVAGVGLVIAIVTILLAL